MTIQQNQQELTSRSNYFTGQDPTAWQTDVTQYGQVSTHNLYPGIDAVYSGNSQQQLEYDLVVAPGADPAAIHLSLQGAQGLRLDDQGNLLIQTSGGTLVEQTPTLYQTHDGVRQAVTGRYTLGTDGTLGFQATGYDPSQPLTIDPVLSYGSYLGGTGTNQGYGVAVDATGILFAEMVALESGKMGAGNPSCNRLLPRHPPGGSRLCVSLPWLGRPCVPRSRAARADRRQGAGARACGSPGSKKRGSYAPPLRIRRPRQRAAPSPLPFPRNEPSLTFGQDLIDQAGAVLPHPTRGQLAALGAAPVFAQQGLDVPAHRGGMDPHLPRDRPHGAPSREGIAGQQAHDLQPANLPHRLTPAVIAPPAASPPADLIPGRGVAPVVAHLW
jgi:hypothetical protein